MALNSVRRIVLSNSISGMSAHPQHSLFSATSLRIAEYSSFSFTSAGSSSCSSSPSSSSSSHMARNDGRRAGAQGRLGSVRRFGITDTLTNFAMKTMESSKGKQFEQMVEHMASSATWNLRSWKLVMESQLSSWLMYIPGMSSTTNAQELTKMKALIGALTESELDHPDRITATDKLRIQSSSGQSLDEVNRMLFLFKQTRIIHEWVRLKKAAGEKLPADEQEMARMQQTDVRLRGIANKINKVGGGKRKTGRGRGLPF